MEMTYCKHCDTEVYAACSLYESKTCGAMEGREPLLVNPTFRKLYLMGSLRNSLVKEIGQRLRVELNYEVFDDWQAAAPDADDCWKVYEEGRGNNYIEALRGYAARQVFDFDLKHLNESTAGLLVLPAGRSAHMELGYLRGQDKKVIILLDGDYDRWDVMYNFASLVTTSIDDVIRELAT